MSSQKLTDLEICNLHKKHKMITGYMIDKDSYFYSCNCMYLSKEHEKCPIHNKHIQSSLNDGGSIVYSCNCIDVGPSERFWKNIKKTTS